MDDEIGQDPRVTRTHSAVMAAAHELLAEEGLQAITHQAVAARAGVGRATIYRHWPERTQLLVAVFSSLALGSPGPSGQDPRARVRQRLEGLRGLLERDAAPAFIALAAQAEHTAALAELRRTVIGPAIDGLAADLAAAGDPRPARTAEALVGALIVRRFWLEVPTPDDVLGDLVDRWTGPPPRNAEGARRVDATQ